jgi:hypothetical protein
MSSSSSYLKPIDAKSEDQIIRLQRDNISRRGFWILADGQTVSICKQKNGEPGGPVLSMPKNVFDEFVAWYQRPQRLRRG